MHNITLPDWAVQRGRKMGRTGAIDTSKAALLVIDVQNAFMPPDIPISRRILDGVVPQTNLLAHAVRLAGGEVMFLRHTTGLEEPYALPAWQLNVGARTRALRASLLPGLPGHEIYAGLDRRPEDTVFDKYRASAFAPPVSGLEDHLIVRGIDTVIICGAATNVCCETTARDAHMRGYKMFVISDATAALTDEEHNAALLNLAVLFADVRTTDEMLGLIEADVARRNRSSPAA